MKKLVNFVLAIIISAGAAADEGMWLPSLIANRIGDMTEKGFKLTAEDIYSINNASLKDCVVQFAGGCTGELISGDGLLITNHHCGYDMIQSHSSVEHDYLTDGFWAANRSEELPNENLSVSFLVRMEDVTETVLKGCTASTTEEERIDIVDKNAESLIIKAEKEGPGYYAEVKPLYYGNQYFLFVYQEFTDVRLVGAPPSSIGKFGGDTDNWMWPRHTGDFSLFRIYADKNNNPAPYSPDNVPYKPKKFFNISLKGVQEDDFTLVYGYPGRTQEYILSDAVDYIANVSDPHKVALRTLRLDIQNEEMGKSAEIRIKYASKNAGIANAWKKWQGEIKGIKKMKTVDTKREFEKKFNEWAAGKSEYEGLIDRMKEIYETEKEYLFVTDYLTEAVLAVEAISFSGRYVQSENREKLAEYFFKDYYKPIDHETFVAMMSEYVANIPEKFQPEYFKKQLKKYGTIEKMADKLYASSVFTDREKLMKASDKKLKSDGFYKLYESFISDYKTNIMPMVTKSENELQLLYRTYMKGQMEFMKDKDFYPDANFTLRVAYGQVKGYEPADGVSYYPVSTLEGIMQKDNPDIYDYNIPQKLRDIYKDKDYGRWEVNGTVPVCFIATNHTTGGNSGSPVIDAEGNLIGVNFDRVWEGTMSDIQFDPEFCRNIVLDIRYALFVIDKVAGASHLIDEMVIVEE